MWHCSATAHLSRGWVFPNCPVWLGPKIVCLQCVKEDVSDKTGCEPDLLSVKQEVLAWNVPEPLSLSCRDAISGAELASVQVGWVGLGRTVEWDPVTGWHLPKFIEQADVIGYSRVF